MTKPPAFQFYADDFLAGTFDLSPADVGIYIRLLCHQWNRGAIPAQPERQERLAGGVVSPEVLEKFSICEDGLLRNKRLEQERDKQNKFRERQSEKGRKSGLTRIEPRFNHGSTTVQPSPQPEGNSPSPSPSPSPIEIEREASPPARPRFQKPSVEEMKLHAAKIGLPETEAEAAWHFYESKGWKVGSQPMRSWQSALVTWRARWQERNGNNPQSHTNGSTSVWSITKAIEAKEEIANALKARHAVETGLDTTWNNEARRAEFYAIRKEIKELKTKLAGMA